jgi:hypothetical protein
MDFGLCQRRRFGSGGLFQWWFVWILVYANGGGLVRVDCSAGVLYGSWFMPTAEVWFGWIVLLVFCMDLGLCQLLRFGSGGLVQWWFVFTMPLISANGYLHVLKV